MYSLFLVICVALLLLSPVALDRWLSVLERRHLRHRLNEDQKKKGSGVAWAFHRAS